MASLISSKLVAPASAAARCCVNISEQSVAGLEEWVSSQQAGDAAPGFGFLRLPPRRKHYVRSMHAQPDGDVHVNIIIHIQHFRCDFFSFRIPPPVTNKRTNN